MSRAYRVQVRENLKQVLRAGDEVRSQLELLSILPQPQMGELLGAALAEGGFVREGDKTSREREGIVIEIDLVSLEVAVRSQAEKEINLEAHEQAIVFDDMGPIHQQQQAARVQNELKKRLAADAGRQQKTLDKQVADKLEGALADTRRELDQAIHRATAEALKRKAAQLGKIKQVADDAETGSLTIVVEV